jgi:hypothetical protein
MNFFLKVVFWAPWFLVPLLILGASFFRRDRARRYQDLITTIAYIVYIALGSNLMPRNLKQSYDAAFMRLDAQLGFNCLAFADFVRHSRIAMIMLLIAYASLPLVIGITWIMEQDHVSRRAVLVGGWLCFLFYAALPAVGPGHFDWVHSRPIPEAPGNCMPSMHLTWALLIAFNARSGKLRIVLWIYAGLIAAATLAMLEHYVIDLIAAVPYTLGVQYLAARLRMPFTSSRQLEQCSGTTVA